MSATIHQIYCTHCTFGTSALERRTGEISDRVLGYSARASSLESEELRKTFRQIERYLYYSLPSDAPSEEKLRLDAATAPKRLIFLPSIGGLQAVGQISYRRMDTSNRVGSYFGHFLLANRNANVWSALECLQLWDAPWIAEDSQDLPFKLSTISELSNFQSPPRPVIDDRLLINFLITTPGQKFDDPGNIIPQRWQEVSTESRASLLTDLIRAYLELGTDRRENALVVVEPSVAALLFYGVARLLPSGKLRDDISFSTFEPAADRVPTALAATVFHDPLSSDLKPEVYRRSRWVMNTFLNRRSTNPPRSKGLYASLIVNVLLSEGWLGVNNLLASIQNAVPTCMADLERLAEAYQFVPTLLSTEASVSCSWHDSPIIRAFISQTARLQLAALPQNSPRWKELANGPNAVQLLEFISSAQADQQATPINLLRDWPEDKLPALLASTRVGMDSKAMVIVRIVERNGSLPKNCASILDGSAKSNEAVIELVHAVIAQLSLPQLLKLQDQLTNEQVPSFLMAAVAAAKSDDAKKPLVHSLIDRLSEDQLIDLLASHTKLRSNLSRYQSIFGRHLEKLLINLPNDAQRFSQRLDVLQAWVELFDDPSEAEKRVASWNVLRREILSLCQSLGQEKQVKRIAGQIFFAIKGCMPEKRYGPDHRGEQKLTCLESLIPALTGSRSSLSDSAWRIIYDNLGGSGLSVRRSSASSTGVPPLSSLANVGFALSKYDRFKKAYWKRYWAIGALVITGALLGVLLVLRMRIKPELIQRTPDKQSQSSPYGVIEKSPSTEKAVTTSATKQVDLRAAPASISEPVNQKVNPANDKNRAPLSGAVAIPKDPVTPVEARAVSGDLPLAPSAEPSYAPQIQRSASPGGKDDSTSATSASAAHKIELSLGTEPQGLPTDHAPGTTPTTNSEFPSLNTQQITPQTGNQSQTNVRANAPPKPDAEPPIMCPQTTMTNSHPLKLLNLKSPTSKLTMNLSGPPYPEGITISLANEKAEPHRWNIEMSWTEGDRKPSRQIGSLVVSPDDKVPRDISLIWNDLSKTIVSHADEARRWLCSAVLQIDGDDDKPRYLALSRPLEFPPVNLVWSPENGVPKLTGTISQRQTGLLNGNNVNLDTGKLEFKEVAGSFSVKKANGTLETFSFRLIDPQGNKSIVPGLKTGLSLAGDACISISRTDTDFKFEISLAKPLVVQDIESKQQQHAKMVDDIKKDLETIGEVKQTDLDDTKYKACMEALKDLASQLQISPLASSQPLEILKNDQKAYKNLYEIVEHQFVTPANEQIKDLNRQIDECDKEIKRSYRDLQDRFTSSSLSAVIIRHVKTKDGIVVRIKQIVIGEMKPAADMASTIP